MKPTDLKIRIQKNIPMPEPRLTGRNGWKAPIYPWAEMEVGDSFLFPQTVGRAAHAAVMGASKDGKKFIARKVDFSYRCWRVK